MENDPSAITIIGMHGVTSSKFSPDVLLVGGMLYKQGFNYLTFDFRDHGTSTCEDSRHSAGQKEIYDVKASIDWLQNEKNIPTSNIGLYGASFGAMIGLMTPAITNDFQALAVVDSHLTLQALLERIGLSGFPGFLFEPVYHYALIFDQINLTEISPDDGPQASNKQPLIIFNGKQSPRVLAHHTDDFKAAENYGISTEVSRYDDLSHTEVMYAYPVEFELKLVNFLEAILMSRRLKIILTIVVVVLVTGFFLLGRTAYFIAGSVSLV